MSGFYSALNKVFDEAETRMPRMSIAGSFDSIDAELTVMAQHTVTRYSSGTGLDDWCQMRCSCLWAGPRRAQSSDSMEFLLRSDERGHREAALRGAA